MSWSISGKTMANEAPPFNPGKYLAECCGSIIQSKYPGHFCECQCGESFVDETWHYARVGGKTKRIPQTELEKELE